MTLDNIPFLEVNALNNEVFLAINRIRYLQRQRADTNIIFNEITKTEQYQSITKDFLQDHIDNLTIDEKIINKINRNRIDTWKYQSFPVCPNDFSAASIVTPINEKTPLIDFTLLNTPKNHKPKSNEKKKQIRESHTESMVKNDKGNTLKNKFLNNLHKDIEDMINRKMESSTEKIQSVYNDELQVL